MVNTDYWPDHATGWQLVKSYASEGNIKDNKRAFDQLYTLYRRGLYTYLFRKGCNETLADDIYQITWEKIIAIKSQLAKLADMQLAITEETQKFSFTAYLCTIARNKYYDYLKHQKLRFNSAQADIEQLVAEGKTEAPEENEAEVQLALDAVAKKMQLGINRMQSISNLPDNLEPCADADQQPERQIELQELARLLGEGIALLPRNQQDAFLLRRMGLSLDMIAKIQGVPRETVRSRLRTALKALEKVLAQWRSV